MAMTMERLQGSFVLAVISAGHYLEEWTAISASDVKVCNAGRVVERPVTSRHCLAPLWTKATTRTSC